MTKKIPSIPGARRTINALKDLGYDLNSAVADILDNSISRGKAKNIYIVFEKDRKGKYYINIADDGIGMSPNILEEAMRIGSSKDDYSNKDLSKYGMGMKTASMSQSSMITVLSKMNASQQTAFSWDLNHIDKSDKWEIDKLDSDEIKKLKTKLVDRGDSKLSDLYIGKSWTIVAWETLTHFQKNYDSYSSKVLSENFYNREIDRLRIYIRLVFHRFIAGENSAKKTNIYFNSKKLNALDPFCRKEKHTIELPLNQKYGNFILENNKSPIVITRYILPTNPTKLGVFKFTSIDAWKESAGTLSQNDSQGYYVYRNNRLINWGGWYGTKAKDEHDKSARASIDLTGEHDTLFTLNVNKTRVQFPPEFINHLKDNVNTKFIAEAKKRYNGSEKAKKKVINNVREKARKVSHLSSELVCGDNISVIENEDVITMKNKYGVIISEDLTYKSLEAGQKIISQPFIGDEKNLFWKMVFNPDSDFQVLVNENHPFYDLVYGDAEKNKKTTAIMDAFLFTMSFIELKCITTKNEFLFEQMKSVASSVLKRFVDEKII